MFSEADFFAQLIFGSIGLAALVYGKNAVLPKKMMIGVAMMVACYVVSPTWLLCLVCSALTVALMVWKD